MCLSGFEKVSDNMCKPCLIGFYSSQIGQLCIEAPKGAFLRFPGSTMFTICPQNWGLLTVKSSSYTTCVSGTFSSSQNTFCVPGAVVAVTTHFYSIRVFCINVHSTSLRNGVLIMQKNSGISWDNSKDSINQYHPNFVRKNPRLLHKVVLKFIYIQHQQNLVSIRLWCGHTVKYSNVSTVQLVVFTSSFEKPYFSSTGLTSAVRPRLVYGSCAEWSWHPQFTSYLWHQSPVKLPSDCDPAHSTSSISPSSVSFY